MIIINITPFIHYRYATLFFGTYIKKYHFPFIVIGPPTFLFKSVSSKMWHIFYGRMEYVRELVKGLRDREGVSGSSLELLDEGNRGKGWWGDVAQSLSDRDGSWFLSSISRKVGVGASTLFWVDVWIGECNLKSLFPRLFELCLNKGCSVEEAGVWIDDTWVWHIGWRRELRSWECDSLASLTDLLLCRKQVVRVPDSWEWNLEMNKFYTVRSAYNFLLERKLDSQAEKQPFCKFLWSNWAAPKAQATAWRILFRRIATRVELKRRGVMDAHSIPLCPMCNQTDETVEHLFVECRCVSLLWSSCLQWIGVNAPLLNHIPGNFLQFCYLGSSKSQRSMLASLWVCVMWSIWKYRNDIVFNNGEWKNEKIVGDIKSFLWNWGRGKGVLSGSDFKSWCSNPWQT